MKVLAIIPAYNEEESLAATVDELVASGAPCDYIVVNDGSHDRTEEICQANGYPHMTHLVNLGLTPGFQTGVRYALAHGYDAVVQFDADGQHRPEDVRSLIEEMECGNSDIVIGSRFVSRTKPLSARMVGSRLIVGVVRLATGVRLSDPTSGLRLYGRRAMEEFARRPDFGPEPDSIAFLMRCGLRTSEVQVEMRDRLAGESYLSPLRSAAYMVRVLASILFAQWFKE